MGKPILGYWNIRGFTEPIRFLLHYKGVDFEDKRYYNYGGDEWYKEDKLTLPLDFPNLPYYIDGNVKLTQSLTILRYVAEKYQLDGDTQEEKLRISLAEQQIVDFRASLFRLLYNVEFEKEKPEFVQKIPPQLKLVQSFLGDRKYLAGDNISYVDFMAYDVFDMYKYVAPHVLDDFPSLKAYQQRMHNLPELQEYLNSSTYTSWPIVGLYATFGGKGPEPKV